MSEAKENRPYLSIVERPENGGDLSIVKALRNYGDLSTVERSENSGDLSINKIEARRHKLRIKLSRLLNEAFVHPKTWSAAKAQPDRVRRATLERLDRALDRLDNGEKRQAPRATVATFYLFAACMIATRCGIAVEAVRAMATDFAHEKPQDEIWLMCARVRRVAMYLVACECQLGNAPLANAIGCSRQNVMQAVKAIEDLREREPALDALIAELAAYGKVA